MKDIRELEVYACIDGYPDYLVTNQGRVLSLHTYHGSDKIREIKTRINKVNGYVYVDLHHNGKKKTFRVHKLVAQAFIHNHENKPEINHIDENKLNNHVSNLEWCDRKYNMTYGTRIERLSKTLSDGRLKGENHPCYGKKYTMKERRKTSKKVMAKSINENKVLIFISLSSAKKYGFNQGHIFECCNGKRKSHKGYTWQYIDNKNED